MGICTRYLKNSALAEDALQETYIRIFKSINNVSDASTFEAWMRKIAVNESLKQCKKRIPFSDVESIDMKQHIHIMPTIEDELSKNDLLKVLNALPDHYRVIFNLYEIEGYSHKEISKMFNIGESTSRTKLMRAKELIKSYLSQLEKEKDIDCVK